MLTGVLKEQQLGMHYCDVSKFFQGKDFSFGIKNKIFRNVRSLFVSSRNETGSPLSRGHCPSVSTCLLTHFSPVQLFVTLWIAACQAPLSMGILQARMLEWVAMPSSRGSSWPKDQTFVSFVSCVDRWGFCFCFFTTSATWEASSCSGASG